jgi:type III secretory pathway component EscV
MGFTKRTQATSYDVLDKESEEKIRAAVRKAEKTSAAQLSPSELKTLSLSLEE